MAKGWKTVRGFDNFGRKDTKNVIQSKNFIKNTRTIPGGDGLKEYSEACYKAKRDREDSILAAKEADKLKSEALLKEADRIIKARTSKKAAKVKTK